MRVLSVMEIESVSGAGLFSRVGASVLGAITFLNVGMAKGGVSGGSTGGILGVGAISAAVTMVIGGVSGVMSGAVYGFVNDWTKTLGEFNKSTEQWFDQSTPAPKV